MHLKSRLLTVVAAGGLAAAGLSIAAPAHVFAATGNGSTQCEDNMGNDDIPIMTAPITLGLQVASPALAGEGLGGGGNQTYVGLCYATGSYSNTGPETAGGIVEAGNTGPGVNAGVQCIPDTDAYNATTGGFAPACVVGTSGTSGTTIIFSLPFGVCAGSCTTSPAPNPTGAIIGALTQQTCSTPGCTSEAYTLQNLCIELDGMPLPGTSCNNSVNVGGVATSGSSPIDYSTAPPNSPCTLGFCVPVDYAGLSGSQLATIFVPGTSASIPVFGEPDCLYYNTSTQPSGCTS